MKVHHLINVLNHFPPQAEVPGAEELIAVATHDLGTTRYSVVATYETLKDGSGHSRAVTLADDE